jgi:hypothetical protein
LLKRNITDIDKMIREKNIVHIQSMYRGFKGKKEYEKLKLDRIIKLWRLVRHMKKFVSRKRAEKRYENMRLGKDAISKIEIENKTKENAAIKIQKNWKDFKGKENVKII